MVRTDLKVMRFPRLLRDGERIHDPLNRQVTALVWETSFAYGLAKNTTVMAAFPFITREMSFNEDGGRGSQRSTGLGDAMFLVQYDGIYNRNRLGGFTRLSGVFGVKPPTGKGGFSTKSTDFITGLIFTDFGPRWKFSGDLEYVITTEGERVKRGNSLSYDASVAYYLLKPPERRDLFLVLELNGKSEAKTKRIGLRLPDSGGNTIFLSPGIEYGFRPNMILEFSVPIPIFQDLQGTQLGRSFTMLGGLRYVF